MKKIAIVTTGHSPLDDRVFYKEAWSLAKAGFSTSIISFKKSGTHCRSGVYFLSLEKPNGILRIVEGLPIIGAFPRYLRFLLLLLRNTVDIIHCHEPDAVWVALAIRYIRKRCRIIYEVREWFPETTIRKGSTSLGGNVRKFVLRGTDILASRRVNAIVSVEEPKAKRYERYVQGRVPVLTIRNYPRTDLFFPSGARPRARAASTVGLYSGGISLDRGLEEMLWLTKQINDQGYDFSLILNGTFIDPQSKRDYYRLTEAYNIARHVTYTGWVQHENVPDYVRQADICFVILHPTEIYYRALPIKLFEYMACAQPIVASDFPLIREIVVGSKCGLLVNPLDKTSIMEATWRLICNESLRESLGKNGLRAVQSMYNWNVSQASLLDLYNSMLRNPNKTRARDNRK